jgi:tetrahydromethanopterin S-methyltransferase subunit F
MGDKRICLSGKRTDRRQARQASRLLARADRVESGLEVTLLAGVIFLVLSLL